MLMHLCAHIKEKMCTKSQDMHGTLWIIGNCCKSLMSSDEIIWGRLWKRFSNIHKQKLGTGKGSLCAGEGEGKQDSFFMGLPMFGSSPSAEEPQPKLNFIHTWVSALCEIQSSACGKYLLVLQHVVILHLLELFCGNSRGGKSKRNNNLPVPSFCPLSSCVQSWCGWCRLGRSAEGKAVAADSQTSPVWIYRWALGKVKCFMVLPLFILKCVMITSQRAFHWGWGCFYRK